MPIGAKNHQHEYKLKVVDIIADNPKYDAERFGYKSMLVDECACGDRHTIQYGERKAVNQRYKELAAPTASPEQPKPLEEK